MKKNLYITQGKIMIAIEKHDNIYSLNILLSHLYVRHMLRMKNLMFSTKKKLNLSQISIIFTEKYGN